jgi:hypothetical protein
VRGSSSPVAPDATRGRFALGSASPAASMARRAACGEGSALRLGAASCEAGRECAPPRL